MAEGDYRAAAQGRVAAAALLNVLFDRNDENGDNQEYPRARLRLARARWDLGGDPPTTNDQLVTSLKHSGVISSSKVEHAMRLLPRDAFLPRGTQDVFEDAPVRLEELGFNVSAPHMHATCLEALDLQANQRVLDIGSGSGILTAMAAYMVGPNGEAVGVDTRRGACILAKRNLRALLAGNPAFSAQAATCRFEVHNVFIPAARHKGRYDRIVCGASCPQSRLDTLLSLLRPEGGLIVSPVDPCELRVITALPDGTVRHRLLSQVPRDIRILRAKLEEERALGLQQALPPSTFATDVAAINGMAGASLGSSLDSSQSAFLAGSSPSEVATPRHSRWPRIPKLFSACSHSAGSASDNEREGSGADSDIMSVDRDADGDETHDVTLPDLGPHDCALVGDGWSIPVHRVMLKARSEVLQALFSSEMRDCQANAISVPEHFSKEAGEAFVAYVYGDTVDARSSDDLLVPVLQLGQYFGCPRLVALAEALLAHGLHPSDHGRAVERAARLLALADEASLAHLKAIALDFIFHNFPDVAASPGYEALGKQQVGLIAAHACASMQDMRRSMVEIESMRSKQKRR